MTHQLQVTDRELKQRVHRSNANMCMSMRVRMCLGSCAHEWMYMVHMHVSMYVSTHAYRSCVPWVWSVGESWWAAGGRACLAGSVYG